MFGVVQNLCKLVSLIAKLFLDKIRHHIGRAQLIGRIKSRIIGRGERMEMPIKSGNLNVVNASWLADTAAL